MGWKDSRKNSEIIANPLPITLQMGLWSNISAHRQEIHNKIFYYAFASIAFTLPFSFTHPLTSLAFRFSLVVLVINWLISGNPKKLISFTFDFYLLTFIIFYVLHIVGLTYTQNLDTGFFQLEKKISFLLLPLIAATSPALKLNIVKNVLKVFVGSVIVASIICLGYAVYRNIALDYGEVNWLFFSYNDLTDIILIQPNYLAIYSSFAALSILYILIENWNDYNIWNKSFLIFLILYLNVFLLLLSGRTQILANTFIILLGVYYYFYRKKQLLKGLLVITTLSAILILTIYQIPIIKERFLETFGIKQTTLWINQYGDGNGTGDVRFLKWKCAWNIIRENWLIGIGTGDVQDALQTQYKLTNFQVAYDSQFNAHNQFLQTWLGLGLIGLLSLFGCLLYPAIKAIRQKNYLFLSFIVLFSICCITESTLERQFGIVFYSFFCSLFLFSRIDEGDATSVS